MARARNIKPGFFANEDLVELPPFTRLLFIGLWTVADRAGRMEDKPKKIKMMLFPADDLDVDAALNALASYNFILRYEHDGARFIQVMEFCKHQNPHKDEKASTIPAPCEHHASTVQEDISHDGNPADSPIPSSPIPDSPIADSLIPDSKFNNNVEQKNLDRARVESLVIDPIPEIFAYWQRIMKSPKSVLDEKRRRSIKSALKNYSAADVCIAIRGCSRTPYNMGDNPSKTRYNGLQLILRDAEHIERFIRHDKDPPKSGAGESVDDHNARVIAEMCGDDDDGRTVEMEE
jgi:hypothetical protein